jgi:hypothetical protein
MKTLNIFLLIVLLGLGGFIAFELVRDSNGSEDPQETNMQTENENDVEVNNEPVAQVEANTFADDVVLVKAFKALIDSGDTDTYKEYVTSLGSTLPAEKAAELNTKISELTDEDWQDQFSLTQKSLVNMSDDADFLFNSDEYVKELEADRYGEIQGVRYYQVVIEVEKDSEGDVISEEGFLLVFAGEGVNTKFVPPIAFHRLIK